MTRGFTTGDAHAIAMIAGKLYAAQRSSFEAWQRYNIEQGGEGRDYNHEIGVAVACDEAADLLARARLVVAADSYGLTADELAQRVADVMKGDHMTHADAMSAIRAEFAEDTPE